MGFKNLIVLRHLLRQDTFTITNLIELLEAIEEDKRSYKQSSEKIQLQNNNGNSSKGQSLGNKQFLGDAPGQRHDSTTLPEEYELKTKSDDSEFQELYLLIVKVLASHQLLDKYISIINDQASTKLGKIISLLNELPSDLQQELLQSVSCKNDYNSTFGINIIDPEVLKFNNLSYKQSELLAKNLLQCLDNRLHGKIFVHTSPYKRCLETCLYVIENLRSQADPAATFVIRIDNFLSDHYYKEYFESETKFPNDNQLVHNILSNFVTDDEVQNQLIEKNLPWLNAKVASLGNVKLEINWDRNQFGKQGRFNHGNLNHLTNRCLEGGKKLMEHYSEDDSSTVVVITHGSIINNYMNNYGKSNSKYDFINIPPGSFINLEHQDKTQWLIKYSNINLPCFKKLNSSDDMIFTYNQMIDLQKLFEKSIQLEDKDDKILFQGSKVPTILTTQDAPAISSDDDSMNVYNFQEAGASELASSNPVSSSVKFEKSVDSSTKFIKNDYGNYYNVNVSRDNVISSKKDSVSRKSCSNLKSDSDTVADKRPRAKSAALFFFADSDNDSDGEAASEDENADTTEAFSCSVSDISKDSNYSGYVSLSSDEEIKKSFELENEGLSDWTKIGKSTEDVPKIEPNPLTFYQPGTFHSETSEDHLAEDYLGLNKNFSEDEEGEDFNPMFAFKRPEKTKSVSDLINTRVERIKSEDDINDNNSKVANKRVRFETISLPIEDKIHKEVEPAVEPKKYVPEPENTAKAPLPENTAKVPLPDAKIILIKNTNSYKNLQLDTDTASKEDLSKHNPTALMSPTSPYNSTDYDNFFHSLNNIGIRTKLPMHSKEEKIIFVSNANNTSHYSVY